MDIQWYPSMSATHQLLQAPDLIGPILFMFLQVPGSNEFDDIFQLFLGSEEISCSKHESRIEKKGPPGYEESSRVTGDPAAVKAMGTANMAGKWPFLMGTKWKNIEPLNGDLPLPSDVIQL